jgi:hypothetical protein
MRNTESLRKRRKNMAYINLRERVLAVISGDR